MGLINDIAKERAKFAFTSPDRWGDSTVHTDVTSGTAVNTTLDCVISPESMDIVEMGTTRKLMRIRKVSFITGLITAVRGNYFTINAEPWSIDSIDAADFDMTRVVVMRPEQAESASRRK